jgi:hypothetical protein
MENTAVEATGEASHMSFFQRLTGIYFEPSKIFEDISRRRSWLGIFLTVCIVALVASYALQARMDPADLARKSFAMTKPFLQKFLGAEQMAQAEEQAVKQAAQPRGFLTKYSPILMTPLMMYITYFILAAIFLLAFLVTGASLNIRKSFTAVVWGTGPPGLLVTLLSLLFIYVKNPADLEIAPVYNVVSNLGMLADSVKHPVLNSLLSSIDLFSIWTVVLLAIGFAAMSEKKLTPGKAAVPIVALWVLWILLKMGFWAIVS